MLNILLGLWSLEILKAGVSNIIARVFLHSYGAYLALYIPVTKSN